MADIAILVAEEYERRLKSSRKNGEKMELLSCVGALGLQFKGSSSSWIRDKLVLIKSEKMVGEPKSQMSLAATNGFFSA